MTLHAEGFRIEGPRLIVPKVWSDKRGYFCETYKESVFRDAGIDDVFCQDNESFSFQGVVRGLHYQKPPDVQAKLVRVVLGAIYDVALDIRAGSATYGEWVSAILTAEGKEVMYVPEGFAHGFQVLSETALVVYKASREYAASSESGILYCDPSVGIEWPLDAGDISDKDARWPKLGSESGSGS